MQRHPFPFLLAALAALYLAERTLAETWRTLALVLAGGLFVVTLSFVLLRLLRARGAAKTATFGTLVAYGVVGLALTLYGYGAYMASVDTRNMLNVVWPAVLLLGLLPAWAMEMVLASTKNVELKEGWRVALAARGALIIAFAVVAFAGVNVAASIWNRKIDVSYFKTTVPSEPTLAVVRELTAPVEMILFYPPGNDVAEELRRYLEPLTLMTDKLSLRTTDHALEPELAKKLKVSANGKLVLKSGERSESYNVGLDMEDARDELRKLDKEVNARLVKLSRTGRVAYFMTGHGERDYSPPSGDSRLSLADFKTLLDSVGYTAKRFGLGEGSSSEVPSDAALLIIAGPTEPLLPGEVDAVKAYLKNGGKLWLLLDPDQSKEQLTSILSPLGVEVAPGMVASERTGVRVEGRRDSPFNFAATKFSTHPSMTTLSQNSGRLAVVLLGAASFKKSKDASKDIKLTFTLRTSNDAWLDNGDAVASPEEKKESLELAAALEGLSTAGEGAPLGRSGRALISGDVDMLGNGIIRNPGNVYFALDGVKWLSGDEATIGELESEEDVPLVHKKDDDAVWFYGTSFLFPALVVGLGMMVSRRKKGD